MPIYSYRCKECKAQFDSFKRLGDDEWEEPTTCEVCGAELTRCWGAEAPLSTFHPTKDLYALSLKQRKQRK